MEVTSRKALEHAGRCRRLADRVVEAFPYWARGEYLQVPGSDDWTTDRTLACSPDCTPPGAVFHCMRREFWPIEQILRERSEWNKGVPFAEWISAPGGPEAMILAECFRHTNFVTTDRYDGIVNRTIYYAGQEHYAFCLALDAIEGDCWRQLESGDSDSGGPNNHLSVELEHTDDGQSLKFRESQSKKAKRPNSPLTRYWLQVKPAIDKKIAGGQSMTDACNAVATQLNNGTFSGVPHFEVTGDAIRKRYSRQQQG
jgi:hypothetical protein